MGCSSLSHTAYHTRLPDSIRRTPDFTARKLCDVPVLCSTERQTLLFSATMPAQLSGFISVGLRDPQLIRLDVENKISDKLHSSFFTVAESAKGAVLLFLLKEVNVAHPPCAVKARMHACTHTRSGRLQRAGTGLAPATSAPGTGLAPATSAPGLGFPLPHLHRDWDLQVIPRDQLTIIFVATRHHVEYTQTLLTSLGFQASGANRTDWLTAPTSAPELSSPLPHLRWDSARGERPAAGRDGVRQYGHVRAKDQRGQVSQRSVQGVPHLHRDRAHPCHICTATGLACATSAWTGSGCKVLVVTDVAARGIDIPLLDNVINVRRRQTELHSVRPCSGQRHPCPGQCHPCPGQCHPCSPSNRRSTFRHCCAPVGSVLVLASGALEHLR